MDKKIEYYYGIIEEITQKLNGNLELSLKNAIQMYQDIEAIYVLDSDGFMITDTILKPGTKMKAPAKKGDRLSHKPYFKVCSDLKTDVFVTYSYVSSATGSLCRTGTKRIKKGDKVYFLCIDFVETYET